MITGRVTFMSLSLSLRCVTMTPWVFEYFVDAAYPCNRINQLLVVIASRKTGKNLPTATKQPTLLTVPLASHCEKCVILDFENSIAESFSRLVSRPMCFGSCGSSSLFLSDIACVQTSPSPSGKNREWPAEKAWEDASLCWKIKWSQANDW